MTQLTLCDATLRDGNHAIAHQLSKKHIAEYTCTASKAGLPIIEVGHGNGLGASSLQLGHARCSDEEALSTACANAGNSKISAHVIPGFATVKRDLAPAIALGVKVIRVASHCTEANLCARHIDYARSQGCTVFGIAMMSHMVDDATLLQQAELLAGYGAEAFIFMDSSGYYLPDDVRRRVAHLVNQLTIPVGFHAHNNLGMGIANSLAAAQAGATIIDGTSRGFGAGAGNAQLEVLVSVLERSGYATSVDPYGAMDLAELAERTFIDRLPTPDSTSIVSGLAGVFSGFKKPVERLAKRYNLDPRDIFFELGKRKVVAGQEDTILEVAEDLVRRAQQEGVS